MPKVEASPNQGGILAKSNSVNNHNNPISTKHKSKRDLTNNPTPINSNQRKRNRVVKKLVRVQLVSNSTQRNLETYTKRNIMDTTTRRRMRRLKIKKKKKKLLVPEQPKSISLNIPLIDDDHLQQATKPRKRIIITRKRLRTTNKFSASTSNTEHNIPISSTQVNNHRNFLDHTQYNTVTEEYENSSEENEIHDDSEETHYSNHNLKDTVTENDEDDDIPEDVDDNDDTIYDEDIADDDIDEDVTETNHIEENATTPKLVTLAESDFFFKSDNDDYPDYPDYADDSETTVKTDEVVIDVTTESNKEEDDDNNTRPTFQDIPEYEPNFPELTESLDAPILLLKTTVFSSIELLTKTVVQSRLRTYTFVVTRVSGTEEIVTSTTEVKPHTKTTVVTEPVTRLTTLTLLDIDPTKSLSNPQSSITSALDKPQSELIQDNQVRNYEEARNLATRVMSNGVEVIVAGDKTIPGEKDFKRLLSAGSHKPVTLKPSTLTDHMVMLMPQDSSEIDSLKSSLYPNQFITKTCLTTFTYLTTFLEGSTTTVSSQEQVVSNIATEERNTGKILPTPAIGITLTQNPKLSVGVFHTTYTYLNTILDGDQPLVVSSKHTVTNTVTAPDDYLSLLKVSGTVSAVKDTNTYYSTIGLEKTLYEGNKTSVMSTKEIVTQVVITESVPPKATSVMTSYIALDVNDNPESSYVTTDVVKTYFVTYTYFNTITRNNKPVVDTNISVSSDVVTEKLYIIPKTSMAMDAQTKEHRYDDNFRIITTKSYLTTFTYFTTLLQEGNRETSTVVNSRTSVVENLVSETVDLSLLDKSNLQQIEKAIEKGSKTVVKTITLYNGETFEITAIANEIETITPSKVLTIEKTQMPDPLIKEEKDLESSVPNVITGSTIVFVDDDPFAQLLTATPELHKKSTEIKNNLNLSEKSTKINKSKRSTKTKAKTESLNISPTRTTKKPNIETTKSKPQSNSDKTKDKKTTPNEKVATKPETDLLGLGSININSLQAIAPVLNAMAGLITTNLKSNRRSDVNLTTTTPQKADVPEDQFEDIQSRSPIYIPVRGLDDEFEIAESQNIATFDWVDPPPNQPITEIHEGVLINNGIPISPGDIITTHSDVIVGKPGRVGPRIPSIPLHQVAQENEIPVGMVPPPLPNDWGKKNHEYKRIPVRGAFDKSQYRQSDYVQHPTQVQNSDFTYNEIGKTPIYAKNQKNYVPNLSYFNTHPFYDKEEPQPVYTNSQPIYAHTYNHNEIPAKLSDEILAAQHPNGINPSENHNEQMILPEVIERSTGQPLLVNIQPSQVAFVNIPFNRTTALIYGGSTEPHRNGQYFDDPSPYPQPEFSADDNNNGGVPQITSVYQPDLPNQKQVNGVIKVGNQLINNEPIVSENANIHVNIQPTKIGYSNKLENPKINFNMPPVSYGLINHGSDFNAHVINHHDAIVKPGNNIKFYSPKDPASNLNNVQKINVNYRKPTNIHTDHVHHNQKPLNIYQDQKIISNIYQDQKVKTNNLNGQKPMMNIYHDQNPKPEVSYDQKSPTNIYHDRNPKPEVFYDQKPPTNMYHDLNPKPEVFYDQKPPTNIYHDRNPKPEVFYDQKPPTNIYHDQNPKPEIFYDQKPPGNIYHDQNPKPEVFYDQKPPTNIYHDQNRKPEVFYDQKLPTNIYHDQHQKPEVFYDQKSPTNIYQDQNQKPNNYHDQKQKLNIHNYQRPIPDSIPLNSQTNFKINNLQKLPVNKKNIRPNNFNMGKPNMEISEFMSPPATSRIYTKRPFTQNKRPLPIPVPPRTHTGGLHHTAGIPQQHQTSQTPADFRPSYPIYEVHVPANNLNTNSYRTQKYPDSEIGDHKEDDIENEDGEVVQESNSRPLLPGEIPLEVIEATSTTDRQIEHIRVSNIPSQRPSTPVVHGHSVLKFATAENPVNSNKNSFVNFYGKETTPATNETINNKIRFPNDNVQFQNKNGEPPDYNGNDKSNVGVGSHEVVSVRDNPYGTQKPILIFINDKEETQDKFFNRNKEDRPAVTSLPINSFKENNDKESEDKFKEFKQREKVTSTPMSVDRVKNNRKNRPAVTSLPINTFKEFNSRERPTVTSLPIDDGFKHHTRVTSQPLNTFIEYNDRNRPTVTSLPINKLKQFNNRDRPAITSIHKDSSFNHGQTQTEQPFLGIPSKTLSSNEILRKDVISPRPISTKKLLTNPPINVRPSSNLNTGEVPSSYNESKVISDMEILKPPPLITEIPINLPTASLAPSSQKPNSFTVNSASGEQTLSTLPSLSEEIAPPPKIEEKVLGMVPPPWSSPKLPTKLTTSKYSLEIDSSTEKPITRPTDTYKYRSRRPYTRRPGFRTTTTTHVPVTTSRRRPVYPYYNATSSTTESIPKNTISPSPSIKVKPSLDIIIGHPQLEIVSTTTEISASEVLPATTQKYRDELDLLGMESGIPNRQSINNNLSSSSTDVITPGVHHAGNEIKVILSPTKPLPSTIKTTFNETKSKIPIPTRYITHTKTATVTITKTTVIKSLGMTPSTLTILVTKTEKTTVVDTVTEVHTLVKPTSIIETITTTLKQASSLYPDDVYGTQYPPIQVKPSLLTPFLSYNDTVADSSENDENLDDFIINETDAPITEDKNKDKDGVIDDNDTILVIMTDKNTKNIVKVPTTYETQDRDEVIPSNKVNNVLLGGVLIANNPEEKEERAMDKCDPECKASRNELCQKIDGLLRCTCRPGFARTFLDRPCLPTYTYDLKLTLDRIGKDTLHFYDDLSNPNSTEHFKFVQATGEALDRMVMQSDLRDIFHGVKVHKFEPAIKGIITKFYLQLSENIEEKRLEDTLKKYLFNNSLSLGGTDIFSSPLMDLEAKDFDECTQPHLHDCSENARCFNLKGTYSCSCMEGFSDLSENMVYPGRICSAEQIGCEKCNYHGTCYARGTDEVLCECFQWYSGQFCHINLKVLLIALVTLGTLLFGLLLTCIILTCVKGKPRNVGVPGGINFLPQGNAGRRNTSDRKAMIQDTSSEEDSKSETSRYVKKPKPAPKKSSKVSLQVSEREEGTNHTISFDDQKDRSLTVMIPRAKYHPAASTSPLINYTSFDVRKPSVPSITNEAKLLSFLDAGPSPNKSEPTRKFSNAQSESIIEEKANSRKTSGALISAGFEVSATVVNNMGTLGTTCGTEADRSENATLIQKISADLLSSTGTRSQFNTLRKSLIDEDLESNANGNGSDWLDMLPRVMTVSEARSFDDATIPPPMKCLRTDYDSKPSPHHHNDEANTMAERDLGSTFLLPHTHLYKPDRGSDISGFESL